MKTFEGLVLIIFLILFIPAILEVSTSIYFRVFFLIIFGIHISIKIINTNFTENYPKVSNVILFSSIITSVILITALVYLELSKCIIQNELFNFLIILIGIGVGSFIISYIRKKENFNFDPKSWEK